MRLAFDLLVRFVTRLELRARKLTGGISFRHRALTGTTISAGVVRTVNAGLSRIRELNEEEVKLAYAQGEWASVIAKQLHDDGEVEV